MYDAPDNGQNIRVSTCSWYPALAFFRSSPNPFSPSGTVSIQRRAQPRLSLVEVISPERRRIQTTNDLSTAWWIVATRSTRCFIAAD